MKHVLKVFSFVPALVMMYIIFSFSAQTGTASGSLSHKVASGIVIMSEKVLSADWDENQEEHYAQMLDLPVRKAAHMTEYFLLAIAVSLPLYVYGLRGMWLMFFAGAICVLFACGDEYHQSFVQGRGPSKKDVLIDSVGVFFGILGVRIICWCVIQAGKNAGERRRIEKMEKTDSFTNTTI